MLVVPAGQGLATPQAEARLLGPKERHLPVVAQLQHTHAEAGAGLLGTGHSIERSGSTSHDTAEMNSTDCSNHTEPANHCRLSVKFS